MPKKTPTSARKPRKATTKKQPKVTERTTAKKIVSNDTRDLSCKSGLKARFHSAAQSVGTWFRDRGQAVARRRASYLRRRPHRSFQMTRRRDYTRSLKLPGYFAFTIEVSQVLWRQKWTFLMVALVFIALTIAFGSLMSQETYASLREAFTFANSEGLFEGVAGEVGQAGYVLMMTIATSLTDNLSDSQRIAAGFFALYVWLTVVWLLRNSMAGKRVKFRDGLYSAGAPIIPTFLVVVILLIQLVPMAIAIIVAMAGWESGFIQEGVASMAAGLGLSLVVVASLYWVVSTFFALVIVTLPGMYPFRAIAIAGDLVIGRRLRLVYRTVWLLLTIVSWWVVIMIPVILLDTFAKSKIEQIAWLPVVPGAVLAMTTFTIIWAAAYIYLLYRKVVDDDASPA